MIAKWRAGSYASVERSRIYALLVGLVTPSPAAAIGTNFARTFALLGWRHTAGQLASELNTAYARYAVLNAAAGRQYTGWLQHEGIYQLMPPVQCQALTYLY